MGLKHSSKIESSTLRTVLLVDVALECGRKAHNTDEHTQHKDDGLNRTDSCNTGDRSFLPNSI